MICIKQKNIFVFLHVFLLFVRMLSFPAGMRLSIHVESVQTLPSHQRQLIAKVLDEKGSAAAFSPTTYCAMWKTRWATAPQGREGYEKYKWYEKIVVGVARNKKGSSATFISSCMY